MFKKTLVITLLVFSFLIFGLWIDAKIITSNFDYPNNGLFLEIDDSKIFYRQLGEGPNIIFLHGIGASQFIWNDVAEELKQKYHLTLIDLPGFGRSSKNIKLDYGLDAQTNRIFETIQKLNLKNNFIVGSSMGGALALWLAKNYPETVDKVAVIGPATNPHLVPFAFYKFPQLSYLIKLFYNRLTLYLSIKTVVTNDELITPKRLAYSLKNHLHDKNSVYTFLKATKSIADSRLPNKLKDIYQPVEILAGKNDKMVTLKYIDELKQIIPHSEVYIHPTGGHHLMEDEPKWVANHLDIFFKR